MLQGGPEAQLQMRKIVLDFNPRLLNAVRNATGYAMHSSRSHDAVIRVYDDAGKRDRDAQARWRLR
jgi:hypothetical protein